MCFVTDSVDKSLRFIQIQIQKLYEVYTRLKYSNCGVSE